MFTSCLSCCSAHLIVYRGGHFYTSVSHVAASSDWNWTIELQLVMCHLPTGSFFFFKKVLRAVEVEEKEESQLPFLRKPDKISLSLLSACYEQHFTPECQREKEKKKKRRRNGAVNRP